MLGAAGGGPLAGGLVETGQRLQCEAMAGEKFAAKLAKVTQRLQADAPNMERPARS